MEDILSSEREWLLTLQNKCSQNHLPPNCWIRATCHWQLNPAMPQWEGQINGLLTHYGSLNAWIVSPNEGDLGLQSTTAFSHLICHHLLLVTGGNNGHNCWSCFVPPILHREAKSHVVGGVALWPHEMLAVRILFPPIGICQSCGNIICGW